MKPLTFDSFQRLVSRNFKPYVWRFAHYVESFSAQWFADTKELDAYTLLRLEVTYESRHRTWSITVQRVSSELTLKHRTSCRALAQECHVEVDPTVIRGRHPNLREQEAIEAIGGYWLLTIVSKCGRVLYPNHKGVVAPLLSRPSEMDDASSHVYRAVDKYLAPVRLKE